MKIEFKSLSLSNFMSYGKQRTVVDLQKTGTTLILGEDLDNTTNGQSSNGVGKAQPLHCKVKIPGGWTTIGKISIGDFIETPSGGTSRVTGVFPQGIRDTFKITFADGRSTEADENHLWKVFSHRWGSHSMSSIKSINYERIKAVYIRPFV